MADNDYQSTLFGQTRVASPFVHADLQFKYRIETIDWGTQVSGGGTVTHVANHSSAQVAVGATNGDAARLRTHRFFRYQSGHATRIGISTIHADAGQTNQVRRWGMFDENDGVFFELSGTTLYAVIRSSATGSVVDTRTAQSSWSITSDNIFNGTLLNLTRGNLYEIEFQWLGVGVVRFYINGSLVHEVNNTNAFTAPWARTATLPVELEIINTGASTASSFECCCCYISNEGGQLAPNFVFAQYNSTPISVGVTEVPLLSIRLASTFNSITNRSSVTPRALAVSTDGARAGVRVILNPTSLTGSSFASSGSNSGVEYDISATALSGGETLWRGFLPEINSALQLDLSDWFNLLGRSLHRDAFNASSDVLTIAGINELSGTTLMRASISWEEIR